MASATPMNEQLIQSRHKDQDELFLPDVEEDDEHDDYTFWSTPLSGTPSFLIQPINVNLSNIPARFPSLKANGPIRRFTRKFTVKKTLRRHKTGDLGAILEEGNNSVRTPQSRPRRDSVGDDNASRISSNDDDDDDDDDGESRGSSFSQEREPRRSVDDIPMRVTRAYTTIDVKPLRSDTAKSLEAPYTIFTQRQVTTIVVVATIAGCFSGFTSNIFYPAVTTISRDLHVSIADINYTVTAYIVFQAISPIFMAAIADARGRRPAYILGFSVYMFANLGLAFNNTYVGLFVLRCVQSCGSSGLSALMAGSISDVVTRAEIGKYISITSMASIVAPSLGPICGGLLAQHLGWHSIFWFLFALSVLFFVPLVTWFPETGRNVVGDGSIMPPKWNRSLVDIRRKRRADLEGREGEKQEPKALPKKKVKFSGIFTILADPETALIVVFIAIVNVGLTAQATTLTVEFERAYSLSSSLQGLLFLPQAVGCLVGACVNAKVIDWNFSRHARKAGIEITKGKQPNLDKIPLERARLEIATPIFGVSGLLLVFYGWALQWRTHIAVPITFMTLFTIAIGVSLSSVTVLVRDLHKSQVATAAAAQTLIRCCFTAATSAFIEPVTHKMGVGWTFTIVGGMYVAGLVIPIYCMKFGMGMRQKRKAREELRKGKSDGEYVGWWYRFKERIHLSSLLQRKSRGPSAYAKLDDTTIKQSI